MWKLPFFEALRDAGRVFAAGAGFDVHAGLPDRPVLTGDGSIADLPVIDRRELDPDGWLQPDIAVAAYFPERAAARSARLTAPARIWVRSLCRRTGGRRRGAVLPPTHLPGTRHRAGRTTSMGRSPRH